MSSSVQTSIETSRSLARKTPTRSIALLAFAGFASQAQVRVTDSLLPQIATDFRTTVGAAAIVVTAYALTHGTIQFIAGPVADRFGKFRMVAIASLAAAILVAACGAVSSLPELALARLATGAAAGWVIPLSMAYIGDVAPPARTQAILARYASGYIVGQLFGQAAGGVLGDLIGWRNVFFVLAGMFGLAAAGLMIELFAGTQAEAEPPPKAAHGVIAGYAAVLTNPLARVVLTIGVLEAALAWGAFAYIGADLHTRFGLSLTFIGITVGCFGIGGLFYAALVKHFMDRFGQIGLVLGGGIVVAAAYAVLALEPVWWLAPVATTVIGLGFYMFHNTLQTKATHMSPQVRGTALAFFTASLYLGQTIGVASGALIIDRAGAVPLFLGTAVAFPLLAVWFALELHRRPPVL